MERLQEARARARASFARSFDLTSGTANVSFHGLEGVQQGTRLSRMVSDACDGLFKAAPAIRSEMLSRDDLTRQAARARRDLLEAMLARTTLEAFGISGYGPERAMYEAVFRHGGLHVAGESGWELVAPGPGSSYYPAWKCLEESIVRQTRPVRASDLQAELHRPPFGIPSSLVPILLTAFLVVHSDDVGVLQDESYQPLLTIDLVERLIKIPGRFTFHSFATVDPGRRLVLDALERRFGAIRSAFPRRNTSLLAAVLPLVRVVRGLPQYTANTTRLSPIARAVRQALLEIREPDRLIFEELPLACATPLGEEPTEARATEFADALNAALRELSTTYRALLSRAAERLFGAFGIAGQGEEARRTLAGRVADTSARALEPRLQGMVAALGDGSLDYFEWVASVCLSVTGRAPTGWTDRDEERLALEVTRLANAFKGVEALQFATSGHGQPDGLLVAITAHDGSQLARVVVPSRITPETLASLQAVIDGTAMPDEAALQQALGVVGRIAERLRERADPATSGRD